MGWARLVLSYFNWRPKAVGAYVVGIERHESQRDLVGRLLLRSDVCLCTYLDHYLTRPDLVLDQADALAALTSLDARDGTAHARGYEGQWAHYIANTPSKPRVSYLTDVCTRFETSLRALERLGT